MGYGDWLHWTSVIRDLFLEINSFSNIEDKINDIKFKIDNRKNEEYGVIGFKFNNKTSPFKIYLKEYKVTNQNKEVFFKNPYIETNSNYPNLVYIKLTSAVYYRNNNFLDNQHVIDTYCANFPINNYIKKPELYFLKSELQKIKKYLPKRQFIFIEPINFKIGRSYPFQKFQNIVNKLKDKILFVQISPSIFGVQKSKKLENVLYYEDIFTFRQTVLFMKYSKLILVNHGGLSIAAGTINKKVIAIYNAMFDPIMTKLDIEDSIYIASDNHKSCYNYHQDPNNIFYKNNPLRCLECHDLYLKHDENIIIDKINKYLNN